jgi:hypothetical protein
VPVLTVVEYCVASAGLGQATAGRCLAVCRTASLMIFA